MSLFYFGPALLGILVVQIFLPDLSWKEKSGFLCLIFDIKKEVFENVVFPLVKGFPEFHLKLQNNWHSLPD